MNIKPMLLRLESAMSRTDLVEKMVLLPEPKTPASQQLKKSAKSINFIVGYNSSPKSQTALDITLCMAHQTRLATSKKVTVQVVHVIEENPSEEGDKAGHSRRREDELIRQERGDLREVGTWRCATPLMLPLPELQLAIPRTTELDPSHFQAIFCQKHQFEQADKLLWQARCLAEEWRGLFKAHLRFGEVVAELRKVVEAEVATLLVLGCTSAKHPLVRELGSKFPCSVLGIPTPLTFHEDWHTAEASFKQLQGLSR